MRFLQQNASANNLVGTPQLSDGSEPVICVFVPAGGSFGGATVSIEGSPDWNGDPATFTTAVWIKLSLIDTSTPADFTANSFAVLNQIAAGFWIRARISGGFNPSNINVTLGM